MCVNVLSYHFFKNTTRPRPIAKKTSYLHVKFELNFDLSNVISHLSNVNIVYYNYVNTHFIIICDRICEKGSYTCIQFFNFKEA